MLRRAHTQISVLCIGGGIAILAASKVFSLPEVAPSIDNLFRTGGAVLGYIFLAAGLIMFSGRRTGDPDAGVPLGALTLTPPSLRNNNTNNFDADAARRVAANFLQWLDEPAAGDGPRWPAFDQLVREMLGEHLRASKVRCFHVAAGTAQLRRLSDPADSDGASGPRTGRDAPGPTPTAPRENAGTQTSTDPGAPSPSESRACPTQGILTHVATTGRPYNAHDPNTGELLRKLAGEDPDRWDLVWPITRDRATIGVVAVANAAAARVSDRNLVNALAGITRLLWLDVHAREALRIAQTTDKASGVLTRADFFATAETALADAYANREPVVLAALALEGLRRLDDHGDWNKRDLLIKRIAKTLNRRTRSDDVIGRFSDDRFVILLRRLDSALATLIAEKTLNAINEAISNNPPPSQGGEGEGSNANGASGPRTARLAHGPIEPRFGLAGSDFNQNGLDELLVRAFNAVEQARQRNQTIHTDPTPNPRRNP